MRTPRGFSFQFQFTGLIRGPTVLSNLPIAFAAISIHRPHTRPDALVMMYFPSNLYFNSQASYEARRAAVTSERGDMRFQFTGLIRGPTIYRQGYYMMWTISIHRPHTRPDADYFSQTPRPKQFQFTGLIRGPTLAS